jgi:hypothetical protein
MIGLSMWIALAQRAKGYDERKTKRNRGIRRVVAYALAMSLLLGLGALHRAKAAAGEAVRGIGRDLAALSDVLTEPHELRLNGETINVSSSSAPGSVKDTLDRFEEHCQKSPTGAWRDDATDGTEGAVACGVDQMRYAYAKRTASGTHVLAAWTDRRFRHEALAAPEDGSDAPGTDSGAVARPPNAQRLLTAEVVGTPYAVRVYASKDDASSLLRAYDDAMTTKGWERIADEKHPGERSYVHGGTVVTMVITPSDKGTGATVTIAEL